MTATSNQDGNSRERRIQQALDSVRFGPDDNLANDRSVCAKGITHKIKAEIEAQGTPFPEPAAYCQAVIRESARRNALIDLYANYAVHELTGATSFHNLQISRIIKNDEDLATLRTIQRTAIGDRQVYQSVKGRDVPLTPELAVDAGVTYGYYNDRQMLAGKSPQQIDEIVSSCYDHQASERSTRLCLMAGVRLGQRIKKDIQLAAEGDGAAISVPAKPKSDNGRGQ